MSNGVVRKPYVFHVPGFDPHPPAGMMRRFARELKRFEKTWSVEAAIADGPDNQTFRIVASGPNWKTETDFHIVRWDEVVAAPARLPAWQRIPLGLLGLLDFAVAAWPRYMRANWRYAVFFFSYPLLLFALLAALSVFIGYLVAGFTGLSLLGIGAGLGAFAVLWHWPGRRLYLQFLFDDFIFSRDYVRRVLPALDAGLDAEAHKLVEVARSHPGEVIVTAHSIGAVLAIDLLDRALQIDPGLKLTLITLGSSILKMGLHSRADFFRAKSERVASAPGISWGDYQAVADVMGCYSRDPLAAMGLPGRGGPLVRIVRLREMLDPAIYKRIRRNPLRMHLQFVSGNNRRHWYDYFMLVCGPLSAEHQLRGDGALTAIGPDGRLLENAPA